MEKLVEIIESAGDEKSHFKSNYADVFDKLTHQASSKNTFSPKVNLAWILLTKAVKHSTPEMLKTLTQRVQKRIGDMDKVTVCDGTLLFAKTVLDTYPALAANNQKILKNLCLVFLTDGYIDNQDSCDEYKSHLINQIFLATTKASTPNAILLAISNIMDESKKAEVNDINFLSFDNIVNEEKRAFFILQLLKLFDLNLQKLPLNGEANVSLFIEVASFLKTLQDKDIKNEIFKIIKSFVILAGHSLLPYIGNIMSLIASYGESKDDSAVQDLNAYLCDFYGAASKIQDAFPMLITQLMDGKDNTVLLKNGPLCNLFSAILRSSGFLLCKKQMAKLLRKLLLEFVTLGTVTTEAVNLLNAFLALNHEEVAVPVNIAQQVIYNSRLDAANLADKDLKIALTYCRMLCSVLTRPVTTGVVKENVQSFENVVEETTVDTKQLLAKMELEEKKSKEDETVEDDEEYADMQRRWHETQAINTLKRKAIEAVQDEIEEKKIKNVTFKDVEDKKAAAAKKAPPKKAELKPKGAFRAVIASNVTDEKKMLNDMFKDFVE
uniref:Cnd3 domain-containing protein n=1 Tax=Rhabditophanes sp. KR3021 TaxID=114890 RepID=A0AC35U445_9BILA